MTYGRDTRVDNSPVLAKTRHEELTTPLYSHSLALPARKRKFRASHHALAELDGPRCHDALLHVLEIPAPCNRLDPLMKALEGEAPVSARRAATQDVDEEVLDEVLLGLLQIFELLNLRVEKGREE